MRRFLMIKKKIFRKPYGKLTDVECPVCLEVKMRLARGYLKCPVCGFRRSSTYYLDLLDNSKRIKEKKNET